ncbi:MAG: hypothetical protein R6U61_02995 [Thermoplasmata archaeon]
MKFVKENPFWLHPVREDQIDTLFINREDKINLVRSIISDFPRIISSMVGGVGTGKSSMLQYIKKIAIEEGYEVGLIKGTSDILKNSEELIKNKDVALIDDINKVDDGKANQFYNCLESLLDQSKFVFFADTFDRDGKTKENREFTVTQSITLPYRMPIDDLREFLTKRMENCVSDDVESFENPFTEGALKMASIRSMGNLRKFLKYSQTAWLSKHSGSKTVTNKEMKKAVIQLDKDYLYGLSNTDYKILWYSTKGPINKKYLKQKADDMHIQTLNKRLERSLSSFVQVRVEGRNSLVSSIYLDIPDGKDILKELLIDLQADIPELYE